MPIFDFSHENENDKRKISFKSRSSRKYLEKLDIFKFIPVPTTHAVSSKCSIFGSILLFILFLSYIIFTLYDFITNNIPTTNTTIVPLDENLIVKSPKFAIGFFAGENFSDSIYNEKYFRFSLQQLIIYKNPKNHTKQQYLPLKKCSHDQIKWMNKSEIYLPYLKCPQNELYLKGQILSSEDQAIRITMHICRNNTKNKIKCAPENKIYDILRKGLFFL